MINVELLKKVCELPGAPGYEQPIREYVIEQVTPYVDEVKVDAMGNVFAIKKGKQDKRVMVAAHLDEIGFMVSHIDDKGFVRFVPLGGFDPKTLTAQRVIIHGKKDIMGVMGTKPIHMMTPEERIKVPAITDYFIDTGMSKEQLDDIIRVGSPITRERELIEMGDCVNCKSLDNRLSVFILLEMLKDLADKEVEYDIYGVFTVQEEVGMRGAQVAAMQINPDFGLGLDVTIAYDLPGAQPHEYITTLGGGAAIKIMDSSTICDYRMVAYLRQLADKHSIKSQSEILPAGGTDTKGIQLFSRNGAIAGAISIPTRHIHQVIEMAHKRDIKNCIALLTHAVQNIHKYDWSF